MNKNLNRNIKLEYFFRFFCNFAMIDGIFVLYLQQKGLSLWQISILEAIFHATSLITEIPSGALADLLGRKRVLLASRMCGILSSLIMLLAHQMWLLGIGFVFTAWSYNLLSGSEEALLYDSFLGLGNEEKYIKTNGRLEFIAEISQGIALFSGGFLAKHSYLLCFLVVIGTDFLAFFLCCFMWEPKFGNGNRGQMTVRTHFIKSLALLKNDGQLIYIYFSSGIHHRKV